MIIYNYRILLIIVKFLSFNENKCKISSFFENLNIFADKTICSIEENMEKEVLTIDQVAIMFSVTKRTIYSLLKENKLPGVKIGGQWRFLRKDLMEVFVKENNQNNEESDYDGETKDENSNC